ncbi:MAG TPA: hypothetical protein VFF68_11570 [Anaerolineaceae bacterium]|nr:hypothetical protein [Anaerolineaceae bacterium]
MEIYRRPVHHGLLSINQTSNKPMDMNTNPATEVKSLPPAQPAQPAQPDSSKRTRWVIIIVAVVVVALVAFGLFMLIRADPATTAEVRDIFIIFMSLLLLLVMLAAVVLVVQLATLINLLQNEIKPMLETMNDTVNNVRGTTAFLSDNLVEPVMKMNEYLAGLMGVVGFFRNLRR